VRTGDDDVALLPVMQRRGDERPRREHGERGADHHGAGQDHRGPVPEPTAEEDEQTEPGDPARGVREHVGAVEAADGEQVLRGLQEQARPEAHRSRPPPPPGRREQPEVEPERDEQQHVRRDLVGRAGAG
jgi:hypothetical protein